MQLLSLVLAAAVVTAWHCPSHPHFNGTLVYTPACCDERGVVVKGKFNASDCFGAVPSNPQQVGYGIKVNKHAKQNYTCEIEGFSIVEGKTSGEGCCSFIKKEEYKCVTVLPGVSP